MGPGVRRDDDGGNFKYTLAFPRRDAPELCMNRPPGGRGECRVPMHPQPRV
jgi:hypothetical protein